MLFAIGLPLLFAVILCIHVVRTGQQLFWLSIILFFPGFGGLVYLIAVVLPSLMNGSAAHKLGQAARETLDPHREYREARAAHEDAPTVRNQSRLAAAAAHMGRHDEAERLYAQAAQGVHAEDPVLLLGRANALIELGRAAEALPVLERLTHQIGGGHTPGVDLALARANEALGRTNEADKAYRAAVERLPGLEAIGRYAAFMAHTGRGAEARDQVAEMDRRLAKTNPRFRREGRAWRDLAAQALARG
jgi:hypothetical protein